VNTYIKNNLIARLTRIETAIEAAETGILEMSAGTIASFELDTGEADQKVIFTNISTFQRYLNGMYAMQELIVRRLTHTTVVSQKVRRKP